MIPKIATDPIEMNVTAGFSFTLLHGLGRQIAGYIVIWKSAPCELTVQNPAADSSRELVLVPSGTASLRLVLL